MSTLPPENSGASWGGPDGEPFAAQIPDDIRELEADLQALRRERAASARRRWARRLTGAGRFSRFGVSVPLVMGVLLVVGLLGGVFSMLSPRALTPPAAPLPLATPTSPPGQPGGLLPVAVLSSHGRALSTRELPRPAVLVLVPPACGCAAAARNITEQVSALPAVEAIFIASGSDESVVDSYAGAAPQSSFAATDPLSILAGAYAARDLTLVFLREDGVVTAVHHGFGAGDHIELGVGDVTTAPTA